MDIDCDMVGNIKPVVLEKLEFANRDLSKSKSILAFSDYYDLDSLNSANFVKN